MPGDQTFDWLASGARMPMRSKLLGGSDQDRCDALLLPKLDVARILPRVREEILEPRSRAVDLTERHERTNLVAERVDVVGIVESRLLRCLELSRVVAELV